ncbi:TlpA disulfide reductase family protein [Flavobacterium sp. Fl-77]|uniref:TlpA disulfide reductase family protein n=1 Tax=Flavobacterium flavipigmentatum TaxID=2893884 RepID=A0AAJ2SHP4_9FLAO|nr:MULTISPECIES: TlpA disulfide reductase family protein [unclassified Flavobacterium]MDX6183914.1 TlpA disulfide reductase family protein [Flavobacterium sp. Fl-33]MDX6187520.1 TlpA disulfide reductase family protein [Flavobacterium sp. Fl-77]UFH37642.1 TlpA family protein disulfide reductase [Flavobacterium sp. F-70]
MKKAILILGFLICVFTNVQAQNVGVDVGDIAPEIDLPDAKGNNVALSSLRGGLVLIDFWASWCGPCIKEQPELLKLYNTYPEKLAIYGVSLDSKKSAWTGTVAKLKIPWTQVSDLKYWSSPVVSSYMIQALPLNFLIDKNGVILAKNIHGAALNDFVKSQLGQ